MNFQWGGNGFNFGGKQNKEEEKPKFQMTDEMFLSELPNDLAKQFNDVYEKIQQISKDLSSNINNSSSSTVEIDVKYIQEQTKEYREGPLTSFARRIDSGYKSYSDSKKELEYAKTDFQNASHFHDTPSPFMKRYTNRLIKDFEQSSQALESYNIRFKPETQFSSNNQNTANQIIPSQVMISILKEEHQAILRCSSRIAQIKRRHDDMITHFSNRGINFYIDQHSQKEKPFCSQVLQDSYKRFLDNKKNTIQKITEETNLFGDYDIAIPQKSITTFGSAFSTPKAIGFGNQK